MSPRIVTNHHESNPLRHRDTIAEKRSTSFALRSHHNQRVIREDSCGLVEKKRLLCTLCGFCGRSVFLIGFLLACLTAVTNAQPTTQPITRFVAIDIRIDPLGQPLGAYQIEFKATQADVQLVGVEGGETQPYKHAPFYDPNALQQSRVVIAAYSTESSLPTTLTRVARLHLQIKGDVAPTYELKLIVAGDKDAKPIDAKATWQLFASDGSK